MKRKMNKDEMLKRALLLVVLLWGWWWVGSSIANKGMNSLSRVGGVMPGVSKITSIAETPHLCAWPWGNPLTASAVEGMTISSDPFFQNVPEQMVQSKYVLEWMEPDVAPRTNLTTQTIQLFRNGAKERGVLVDAPFSICGSESVGIWNTGKISVGEEHGWGEDDEDWRHEFWPLLGAWEVRPDLSTNSAVLYGTTYTNELPASFFIRWNDVFLGGDTNLCASFEAEFFADTDDVVFRYFTGCDAQAVLTECAMGVTMSGAAWTAPGVAANREIRLHRLGTLEEETTVFPGLYLTRFEAWYHQIDPTLEYDIPPGLLLSIGLCPNHPETWNDALPPDFVNFMNYYGYTLAELLMTHCLNPFIWTPDPLDLMTTDNPNHPYLNPNGNGTPLNFIQAEPLPPGTLALLIINNLRLPLSPASPQTFTLYLPKEAMLTFEFRSLRDPTVDLSIAPANANNPPAVWLDDPDGVFGGDFTEKSAQLTKPLLQTMQTRNGGNGGRGGGTGGQFSMPTMKIVPNSKISVCVRGNVTEWYTVAFTPDSLNPAMSTTVRWTSDGWTRETQNNSARLHISENRYSATLTATARLYLGALTDSVKFHDCTPPGQPITQESGCPAHFALNVKLITDKTQLTLKHDREANLQITHDPADVTAYRIEIKKNSAINWSTLSDTQALIPWLATVADKFQLRGVVTANNTEYASYNTLNVTVQFPHRSQIMLDPAVSNYMEQVWSSTKAYSIANPNYVREEGFYIGLDTEANEYIMVEKKEGDPVHINDVMNKIKTPSISWPGPRPADSIANPTPLDKPIYTVGVFHTHTPQFYIRPSSFRGVGPSIDDMNFTLDPRRYVPGLVYDYIGTNGVVYGEHPIHAPTKIYTTNPERRLLP